MPIGQQEGNGNGGNGDQDPPGPLPRKSLQERLQQRQLEQDMLGRKKEPLTDQQLLDELGKIDLSDPETLQRLKNLSQRSGIPLDRLIGGPKLKGDDDKDDQQDTPSEEPPEDTEKE